MSLIGLLILLVIAAIAGSLGQALSGYSVGGCLMSIVVGFIGAFLGLWFARTLNLPNPCQLRSREKPFLSSGRSSGRLYSVQCLVSCPGGAGFGRSLDSWPDNLVACSKIWRIEL